MIIYCDEVCEHSPDIPFTHYVVKLERKVRGELRITEMIICSFCRHWIKKDAPSCNCKAGCHTEARYGQAEGFKITRQKIPVPKVRASRRVV